MSLRVIRTGASLELSIDALDEAGERVSLRYAPSISSCQAASPTSEELALHFFAFDPLVGEGGACGVRLQGTLGPHPVTLIACPDPHGPWCRVRFDLHPREPLAVTRLQHRWHFEPEWADPDVSWPPQTVCGSQLSGHAAAFFQVGPLFSALVPDLEDGDSSRLRLQVDAADSLALDYGIAVEDAALIPSDRPLQFSYAICLDTRALADSGFQQVVRLLGNHDALTSFSIVPQPTRPGELPPLPPVADDGGWAPFGREGTPAEIAALVRHYLARAADEDWHGLDLGLRWLDRLCLQQHLVEMPGGSPFGSFGLGADWTAAARHLPQLLLTAFRATGIQEYAYRALAAICALPEEDRAVLLCPLREEFGDIYLNTDFSNAVLLTPIDRFAFRLTPTAVKLQVTGTRTVDPLRLVVDGMQDELAVTVNGEHLGTLPAGVLREGIELPPSPRISA